MFGTKNFIPSLEVYENQVARAETQKNVTQQF